MEENIIFIEKCLKKYEYPNIYEADIGEILGGSNRIFLLSWLYKLIQGECSEPSTEVLSNFLNAYGFCSASQTEGFIQMSLDYPIQVQIFCRIFRMLNTVRKESVENSDELSLEMIQNFVKTDVNIFRSFGHLKTCENVPKRDTNTKSLDHIQCMNDTNNKIKSLSVMKEKINCTAAIISDILKYKDITDFNISIDDDNIKAVEEFNENLSKAKEVIKNIQIMSNLKDGLTFDQVIIPEETENEYIRMAKEIVKLIYEI
ncbi:uncharacterized protein LOC123309092 [Coccinella septempunctata]|uniref:uncharacterized protein LOC123309092 n=1 Tax=Coccinella septempunctata TaxID=41139 RepID=UPI001D07A845|nr:uncharacterized protein LOC123309092 [Coccinella septempunctata]